MALVASGCLSPGQARALELVNADREAVGLRSLPPSVVAAEKAQAWADRLAAEDALYHSTLSDGITVRWCSLGENIGYGPTVAAVEHAYMGSPTHRTNILRANWSGLGTGVARRHGEVWVVQVFIRTC
ncbi:MAG: CAP domain-containing protein [Acidimicrobiales bacterium]